MFEHQRRHTYPSIIEEVKPSLLETTYNWITGFFERTLGLPTVVYSQLRKLIVDVPKN
jgi:hypothetical protein